MPINPELTRRQKTSFIPGARCKHLCAMREELLAWFDANKRDLPWRRSSDPYAVWLSEMMLQQTQVVTVISYFERFMSRFPSIHDLAAANLDDALQMWAGLGYYARARNLHAAAKRIVEQHEGRVPDSVEELSELPGIGAYTAGAIASIAYGKKAPVVDGNVARVLSRIFSIQQDVRVGPGRDKAWRMAAKLLPDDRCGDHNQALMELGATVCLPGEAAQCLICPVLRHCRAYKDGTVAQLPVKPRKVVVKSETHIVAAVLKNDKWLFVRRPQTGLWAGLWELPTGPSDGEPSAKQAVQLAAKHHPGKFKSSSKPFCHFSRQLTHRTITFVGYMLEASTPARSTAEDLRWKKLDERSAMGMSSAMRAICNSLEDFLSRSR